jgi:hypothetical protein
VPHVRIAVAEKQFGTMPAIAREMLQHFNGAELFVVPPLPPLEWGEDWYIDKLTPAWRASGLNRDRDWAVAMMNYGGLILFNESRGISEWDTGESRWLLENMAFGDWIEKVIADGETMMAELKQDEL